MVGGDEATECQTAVGLGLEHVHHLAPKLGHLLRQGGQTRGSRLCSDQQELYCNIIFICWTFNFVNFLGRAMHKVKIPTKYLFDRNFAYKYEYP